jgi:Fe-S cluster biogenesis protein NfuA
VPNAPPLNEANVEQVLDGVRPFLSVTGGSIFLDALTGVGGLQPTIVLRMDGESVSLQSVKMEIMQRLQRNFMAPGLRIEWV